MSLEDKRQTLLGIFHETKDVFTLKVRSTPGVSCRQLTDRQRQLCRPPCLSLPTGLLQPPQEIEKLGSKRGVVLQSIKEVLQVGAGCWVLAAGCRPCLRDPTVCAEHHGPGVCADRVPGNVQCHDGERRKPCLVSKRCMASGF